MSGPDPQAPTVLADAAENDTEAVRGALVRALTEKSEDTAFAQQMVELFSRMAVAPDAARAMARAPACVESLAMLMRTHTHSVSFIGECCALVAALCVDEESASLVGQPQMFSAISTAM